MQVPVPVRTGTDASKESNRAKPHDEGPFVPARPRARTKIAPSGQSLPPQRALLLARGGYFSSASFSRSSDLNPLFQEFQVKYEGAVFLLAALVMFWA